MNSDLSALRGRFQIKALSLAAGLIVLAASGLAQNYWQGPANGSADYNIATNWAGGVVPTGGSANPANDNGSNSVILIQAGDPTWSVNSVRAGWENNASGSYLQTGGTVTTVLKYRLAAGNNGTANNSPNSGSVAYYTLNGGTINCGNDFNVGELGTATLNINGGVINCSGNFAVNNYNGAGNSGVNSVTDVVNQTSGTITCTGGSQMFVGNGGAAIFNMSGGTNTVNNYIAFGRSGGNGTFNMTGGRLVQNGGGNLLVGTAFQNPNGGTPVGVLNQSGGTISCKGQFLIPENSPAVGTANLSGTAVVIVHDWIAVGRSGGSGTLTMTNSVAITRDNSNDSGAHFDLASGGPGELDQNGGTITDLSSDFWIGDGATGTWNMNGGAAYLNNVVMSKSGNATATLSLNGGLIQASSVTCTAPSALTTLNLNGGTLQANANSSAFINGIFQAQIGTGGAVIDSQTFSVTIPQALLDNNGGAATVTKLGSGTVILSGANTFGGAMTVSAGLLEVSTASSGGGAVLAGNTAGFGALVTSANGQLPVASLTMGGATGGTLAFDLGGFGNPSSAPLNLAGAFTANGTITVNVAATVLSVGTIPLVQFASLAGTHTFVTGSLPAGVVAHLATTGTQLQLVVTSSGAPRWDGNVTGAWDLGTNQDWFDLGTMVLTTYSDGKPVVFDDNAAGTTTVNLTATVSPASVNFNNNAKPYTILGTGKISGNIGLKINGPGAVALKNTGGNNFTGPVTVLNGGSLSVTNLANGGSPSAIGASSSSSTNLVVDNATFSYGGAPVAVNRGLTIAGTNSTLDAEGNLTLGGAVLSQFNVIEGGSGLVKVGPAQLALTAVGANQFGNSFSPGAQVQQGTLLLDGSAGGQTNHTVNEMWVGSTPSYGAALILTNTTLNVDSWLGLGRINGGINNTSTVTLYNSTMTVGNMSLGWDGGQGGNLSSQFVTLNGSSVFTNYGAVNLAEGANASFALNVNGTSVFWVRNPFYICLNQNTTGSVVVANSGRLIQANGWFDIGQGNNCVASMLVKDTGSVSLDGDCNLADTAGGAMATLTVQDNATLHANNLFVGKSSGSVCTVNIAGSAAVNFSNFIRLADGSGSTGNLNISGGSLTAVQYINMASDSASTANVTIAGGSLTGGNDVTVGDQGTAVVTVNGGVLTVPNTLYLSRGSGAANGTVNLNAGGTIVSGNINNGWAYNQGSTSPTFNPNAFNFNGGTLKPYGTYSYIFPNVNAVVQAGGAIIDDNGHTVEVGAALVDGGGGGGLTKTNTGTLLLEGANTYTGTTVVRAGALAGVGSIAGPVTVSSGAAIGAGTGTIGTLAINNSLTLSAGSTAFFRLNTTTNDQITGLTSVSYNGALVVTNINGSAPPGGQVYSLFSSSAPGTGNFSSVTVLPSGSGTFSPATGQLTIAANPVFNPPVVSAGHLILTGTGGTGGSGYTLLTTTNVIAPKSTWATNTTGVFNGSGGFSNNIPINFSEKSRFFDVRVP